MEIVKGKIGNALTSTASDHVVAVTHDIYDEVQERYQDDINGYVLDQVFDINQMLSCFSSGVWENELHWSNTALWDNNKYAITDDLQKQIDQQTETHKADIKAIVNRFTDDEKDINNISQALKELRNNNSEEHQAITQTLSKHNERLTELEALTEEHDRQILDLLNGLNCFGEGQWHNELKWSDNALWENSNLMCDTFADIYQQIENHNLALNNLEKEIESIKKEASDFLKTVNETFADFRKEHGDFKKEHETFREEHNSINERIDEVVTHQEKVDSLNTEQQRQIDILLLNASLIAVGIWDNDLLWVNESEWTNYKGVGEGQDRIDDLYEKLAQTNEDVVAANQEIANNTSLIEDNRNLIGVNRNDILQCMSDIADNAEAIEVNAENITNNNSAIEELRKDFVDEHRDVAYQFRAIGREQTAQNNDIANLGEHFGCFVDGIWGNLFLWDNEHLWANEAGVVKSALDEHTAEIQKLNEALTQTKQATETNKQLIDEQAQVIEQHQSDIVQCQTNIEQNTKDIQTNIANITQNEKNISDNSSEIKSIKETAYQEHRDTAYQFRAIDRKQTAQDEEILTLGSHFGCFVDGIWGNLFLWDNEHLWANESGIVASQQEEMSAHDVRITALETALVQLLETAKVQQVQIEKQQSQLDALMEVFTVTNIGKWQNALLWDNSTKWSDSLLTEQIENSASGTANVAVRSYDAETETISI